MLHTAPQQVSKLQELLKCTICSSCTILLINQVPHPGILYQPLLTISPSPHIQILSIHDPAQILHAPHLHIPSWPYKLPQTFSTSLLALVIFCCTLFNCPIIPSLDRNSSLRCDSTWVPTHLLHPSPELLRLRNWRSLLVSQHLTQCLTERSCSNFCWVYEMLIPHIWKSHLEVYTSNICGKGNEGISCNS